MNQFTELHELPHDQARRILAKTAESVGCPWIEAIVLAQSAWHLTNRGLDGIAYLLRYLLLLDGDKSLPRSAITDALPKLLMTLNQPSHRTLSFTGPSALYCSSRLWDSTWTPRSENWTASSTPFGIKRWCIRCQRDFGSKARIRSAFTT